MHLPRSFTTASALLASWVCAGCVPLAMPVYVADPGVGQPIHSTCSLDRGVPVGVAIDLRGIRANVSLIDSASPGFVEVRFDVPRGRTLVLLENIVHVDWRSARAAQELGFPNISLVDGPAVNSYRGSPALRKYMLPVSTPLVGERMVVGDQSWDRHFWIAAHLDIDGASDAWVTLPALTVDGVPADVPALHFHRRLLIGLAPLNC